MRLLLLILMFVPVLRSRAAIIDAASAALSDVQAAVASAADGDIVRVPAGTNTWTGAVSTGKRIIIEGAGRLADGGASTVITQQTFGCFGISGPVRIKGFTILMDTGTTAINVSAGHGWRVDHNEFRSLRSTHVLGLRVQGNPHPTGLWDNNIHFNARCLITSPYTSAGQQNSWASPTDLGTTNFVYLEDNTFQINYSGNVIDGNYGARYVARYNTIIDGQIQAHGIAGNARGVRAWEFYGNTFIQQVINPMWTPFFLRSGTGVIFSNKLMGNWTSPNVTMDVRRGYNAYGAGGRTDGHSQWDGNTTNGIAQATGTHTGGTSATILTDDTKSWTPNEFLVTINGQNFSRWVYNVTDGSKGQITANTATTITATLQGGEDNQWENGDEYFITGGYPSRDQIGRGQDQYLWTTYWDGTAPPQASEPVYIWGNDGITGVSVANGTGFLIKANRDYILGEAKPGYTPLEYPHPLRAEESGTGSGEDETPPVVTITGPTTGTTYATHENVIMLSGTASDDVGVITVIWTNAAAGGSAGTASGTTGWSASIALEEGENLITIIATDAAGNVGTDQITVTYDLDVVPLMDGLTFEAEDGAIDSPFAIAAGAISQPGVTTDPANGGLARYRVTIPSTSTYIIKMVVDAPNSGSDSVFVSWDVDATQEAPGNIFGIIPAQSLTAGFEERTVSWFGQGLTNNFPDHFPKVWALDAGVHTLYIRGREPMKIDSITVEEVIWNAPAAPTDLEITPIDSATLELNWIDASDNETGFVVEMVVDDWQPIATVEANVTSYRVSGLRFGVSYAFRVKAINGDGSSLYSNVAESFTAQPERIYFPIRIVEAP